MFSRCAPFGSVHMMVSNRFTQILEDYLYIYDCPNVNWVMGNICINDDTINIKQNTTKRCTYFEMNCFNWLLNYKWLYHICVARASQYNCRKHDLYSLSCKTSYRQISRSLKVAILDVIMTVSRWNFTGFSAGLLPRYLSNNRAIKRV